jgi:hypothetical protein
VYGIWREDGVIIGWRCHSLKTDPLM